MKQRNQTQPLFNHTYMNGERVLFRMKLIHYDGNVMFTGWFWSFIWQRYEFLKRIFPQILCILGADFCSEQYSSFFFAKEVQPFNAAIWMVKIKSLSLSDFNRMQVTSTSDSILGSGIRQEKTIPI